MLRVTTLCSFLAGLAVIAAGCVGTDSGSEPQPAPVIPGYEPRPGGAATAGRGAEELPVSVPSPLTQEAAVKIALEMSPNLHAALARIRAAEARVTQSNAGYYPSIDLTAGASRTRQNFGTFGGTGIDVITRYWSYSTALTANWMLFDGLAREARVRESESGTLESLSAYEDVRRILIQAMDLAFNNALLAIEKKRIAEADAEFNSRLVEETRLRHEAGSAALSEKLNFEIRLNQARTQLILAGKDLQVASAVLAELMGLPGELDPSGFEFAALEEETEADLTEPVEDAQLALALVARPDLEGLRHAVASSEARIDQSRAAFYPSLFLQGSYGWLRIDNPHFDEDDLNASASLNLAWNLFNGMADSAAVKVDRAVTDQRKKELAAQWLAVMSEVRQSVAELRHAQEQVRLQKENYRLTLYTRDLVLKEYNAGQASLVRMNEAQRDLTEAEGNLSLARIALRQSWNNLDSATARNLSVWKEIQPK